MPCNTLTRHSIVDAARLWLGTPFKHQGRRKGIGVDCAGLLVGVARDLGLEPIDDTTYKHRPDPRALSAVLDKQLASISASQALPGDILRMAFFDLPTHLAIVTDIGIIHACAQYRSVVEHVLGEPWKSAVVLAYRLPGVV